MNIYNGTLAVGDSYAHIDGDSFDIKGCTTAGQIDDTNDDVFAVFGKEITLGSRNWNQPIGNYSQVYGHDCVAWGNYAFASGYKTKAYGDYSHAEGDSTSVYGQASHAEGLMTSVIALSGVHPDAAHVEGYNSEAGGNVSHAEGEFTKAYGGASHAEGSQTEAKGICSHSQNLGTLADSDNQTAIGSFNVSDANGAYALIIGNGTADVSRSDALKVDWGGNIITNGYIIDTNGVKRTPKVLTSTTISASTTSYTFSDSAITTTSVLDLYDSIFGFSPTNMTVSNGSCTVTFPAQSSSHTMKLFIY